MFSFIIPSYLRGDLLRSCVNSLIYNKRRFDTNEIIVIRNGTNESVVATCEFLKTTHPKKVRIIELPKNVGYGAALNIGLTAAQMPYVVFMNDDTQAFCGYDRTLYEGLQEDGVGCVGIDGCQLKIVNGCYEFAGKDPNKPIDYIEGWFMAGPTNIFREVGGMSAEYGIAFSEDADFSFKIVEAGYKLKVIPGVVHHFGHQTVSATKGIDWLTIIAENNKILTDKWINRR